MLRGRIHAGLTAIAAILAIAPGCARRSTAKLPAPAKAGATETGIASWYGAPYHGRRAASGEIYDQEQFTAAHRTLPFGTWVEVTDLDNGKRVEVRINDRGPFARGRIIDLSFAAARRIEMVRAGTARVRLKIIEPPEVERYAVQAGAFSSRERAEALAKKFGDSRVEEFGSLWRVVVGHGMREQDAARLAEQVRKIAGEALVVADR